VSESNIGVIQPDLALCNKFVFGRAKLPGCEFRLVCKSIPDQEWFSADGIAVEFDFGNLLPSS
jgi:hypothetical protein